MAFVTTDTTVKDSLQLIWIRDNAKERIMPLSLFGELPQPLIDSLDIQNGVPASISTFLLETNGQYMLFDTGVGAPDSRLIPGLAAAGLSPTNIDYIYLTHFHGDHIGGMMKGDSVVFPNAEVYAAQAEYDGWMQMPDEKKAQVTRTMTVYQPVRRWGYITCQCSGDGGHRPHSRSHCISSGWFSYRRGFGSWCSVAVTTSGILRGIRHGSGSCYSDPHILFKIC